MNTTLTNYASPRIPKIALVKIKTYLLLITLLLISLGLYFLVWTIEYATLTSSYYYLLMIMSGISFVIGKIAGKIPINKNVFDMWIYIGAMNINPLILGIISPEESILSILFMIGFLFSVFTQVCSWSNKYSAAAF